MRRYALRDDQWDRIKDFLPGREGYVGGRALIDTLKQRAITPVIPPRANRKAPRECDFVLYRERNLVER
jgi:hypothetical protein